MFRVVQFFYRRPVHSFASLCHRFVCVHMFACIFREIFFPLNYTAVSKYVQMLQNQKWFIACSPCTDFIRPFSPVVHVQCMCVCVWVYFSSLFCSHQMHSKTSSELSAPQCESHAKLCNTYKSHLETLPHPLCIAKMRLCCSFFLRSFSFSIYWPFRWLSNFFLLARRFSLTAHHFFPSSVSIFFPNMPGEKWSDKQ